MEHRIIGWLRNFLTPWYLSIIGTRDEFAWAAAGFLTVLEDDSAVDPDCIDAAAEGGGVLGSGVVDDGFRVKYCDIGIFAC